MISGLKKRFPKLGFMKPVGQQHLYFQNERIDKDVVLFKEYFHMSNNYKEMSPVIIPAGFTRDFLDNKIQIDHLQNKIKDSFNKIYISSDYVIVEGTGHVGVGSIINLNNAQVAAMLGLDVIIIGSGGLGSTFDELSLNKAICDQLGVKIRGVILNRVIEAKKDMITNYMTTALNRWGIPLIGCVPYNRFLNTPSMRDFETLFNTALISGHKFQHKHFEYNRLVATSVETFKEVIIANQLIITPATREDIILAVIERHDHHMTAKLSHEPEHGLILTGRHPPAPSIIEKLHSLGIPSLYAAISSFDAMQLITSFTAKIRQDDISKVEKAIQLVESNLNFDLIC